MGKLSAGPCLLISADFEAGLLEFLSIQLFYKLHQDLLTRINLTFHFANFIVLTFS